MMRKLALDSQEIFSELESDILAILWARGYGESRYLHNIAGARHKVTHSTMSVTLSRLYAQGLLTRKARKDLGGIRFVYYPKYTKEQIGDQVASKFVNFLRKSFGDACVANLKRKLR